MKTASRKLERNRKRHIKNSFEYKKFGANALDFIANSNARINIEEGAIRSSKTINATIAFLRFISKSTHDEFLQSGNTRASLYRNVLKDELAMLEGMGIEHDHRPGDGYLQIEDRTIWLLGYHNESVIKVIRGMTIGGWYADEIVTYPKVTVEETLDRLSLEDARSYWTMNPDSPHHYINKEYITNRALLDAGDVKHWHFVLRDNQNLPESYIQFLERRYPPGTLNHKRKILGLWVIAEGAIYDRFVEAHHTFTKKPFPSYDYYVITTDEGLGNVTVFGLFGIKRMSDGNHYHLLDEVYWDVAQHQGRQLTAYELIHGDEGNHFPGALNLIQDRPLHAFFTPHDAATLRAELKKLFHQGKPLPVQTYMPNVKEDIQEIQKLIVQERFKISKKCTDSIAQIQTYAWDPKAQARGEDKPLKINDHCPDMWRAAIMGTRYFSTGGYTRSRHKKPF